jgi:hypothetical protein
MSDGVRLEMVHCLEKLSHLPFPATLTEAVDFFIKQRAPEGKVNLHRAIDQFIAELDRKRRDATYVRNTRRELVRFLEAVDPGAPLPSKKVHEVTRQEIKTWLEGDPEAEDSRSKKTYNNLRGTVSSFYSWAVKEHYVATNPVKEIEPQEVDVMIPGILSPDEMTQLMAGAIEQKMTDLIPGFALAAWGCYRRSEIISPRWNQIDFRVGKDPDDREKTFEYATVKLDGDQAKNRAVRTQRLPRSSRSPELRFPPAKNETPARTARTTASATSAG